MAGEADRDPPTFAVHDDFRANGGARIGLLLV
jgi:hypothetical protein